MAMFYITYRWLWAKFERWCIVFMLNTSMRICSSEDQQGLMTQSIIVCLLLCCRELFSITTWQPVVWLLLKKRYRNSISRHNYSSWVHISSGHSGLWHLVYRQKWILTIWYVFYFFFQAEDGIRDYKVTGVQTCALPIWPAFYTAHFSLQQRPRFLYLPILAAAAPLLFILPISRCGSAPAF